jgi:hypothetical protein
MPSLRASTAAEPEPLESATLLLPAALLELPAAPDELELLPDAEPVLGAPVLLVAPPL